MQSAEDLEQDIESLSREISTLSKRRNELKAIRLRQEYSELSDHPVVREFESLFDRFPTLYEALANENRRKDSDEETQATTAEVEFDVSKKRRIDSNDTSTSVPQHRLFDKTISNLINTSPSKRRVNLQSRRHVRELESKVQLENAFRLFGITFFPVVDPIDISVEGTDKIEIGRKMLGIRLEVFNELFGQFEHPHYVLLKQHAKSASWGLFKDTLPAYIGLETIFRSANGGILTTLDEVYLFAKQVYIRLLARSTRMQILQELQDTGLVAHLDVDLQSAVVSFDIQSVRVQLLLQNDEVTSCDTTDKDLRVFLLGPIRELKLKLQHFKNF